MQQRYAAIPLPLRASIATNEIRSSRIAAVRRMSEDGGWLLLATIDARNENAAALRGYLQRAFVEIVADRPTSVERVVDRLNDGICTVDGDARAIATAFVARYRPAQRHVSYASAGHRPVFVITDFGLRDLPVTGVPLGRARYNRYDAIDVRLRDDDALVAMTGVAANVDTLSSCVHAARLGADAAPARHVLDTLADGIDAAAVAIVI